MLVSHTTTIVISENISSAITVIIVSVNHHDECIHESSFTVVLAFYMEYHSSNSKHINGI